MMVIGVDYHPSFQQIAFLMEETGECGERRLNHSDGEAEKFYRDLQQRGTHVRVGMEATGYERWYERLLAELGFELWIGDPAEIKAKRVRKPKTDREDAKLLLKLLLEDRFPRIWVPSPENRDLRQLLWHRHRLVQMRTRIMNQLQTLAMNENKRWKGKSWSDGGRAALEKLLLAFWASRHRQELGLKTRGRIGHTGTESTEREPPRLETRKTKPEDTLPLVFLDVWQRKGLQAGFLEVLFLEELRADDIGQKRAKTRSWLGSAESKGLSVL